MNQYSKTRSILNQLTNRRNLEEKEVNTVGKNLLMVFTGTNFGTEKVLKSLVNQRGSNFYYDVIFTEAAEVLLDKEKICHTLQPRRIFTEKQDLYRNDILEGIDCVVVPTPTQNTAIKLTLGIQDQLIPRLLWESLWRNIPVWMGFNHLYSYKGKETKVTALQQVLVGYIEKLKEMGVKNLKDTEDFSQLLQDSPHQKPLILTEGDLLKYPKDQKEIHVAYGSIITPLAYDTAKALGIRIVKEENSKLKEG